MKSHTSISGKMLLAFMGIVFLVAIPNRVQADFFSDLEKVAAVVQEVSKWTSIASTLLSTDDDLEKYLHDEVVAQIESQNGISTSAWLDAIGTRVVAASERPSLPNGLSYTFRIISTNDYNAFAVPGGAIYVTKPLYDALDADEMAFVLGHEIAHVCKKHSIVKAKQSAAFSGLAEVADKLIKSDQQTKQLLDILVNATCAAIQAGYSRAEEREADACGVVFASHADYRAMAAASALTKLGNLTGSWGNLCFLWCDHPALEERIASVKQEAAELAASSEPSENQTTSGLANTTPSGSQNAVVAFADFSAWPDGDFLTNCSNLSASGWDKNPSYKHSLRLLQKGAVLQCKFSLNQAPGSASLLVEHLSSYSQGAPNGGYSPVTLRVNGRVITSNYSPGSHSMITERWSLGNALKAGENEISWEAGDLATHYWLKQWRIVAN